MGREGGLAQGVARLFGGTRCPGPTRLGGNLCRRQLCPGEKKGACVGKTQKGKGTKWLVVVDGQGVPVGNLLASASPAEVPLVEQTLAIIAVPRSGRGRPRQKPEQLLYDKACDSDALRTRLPDRGIDLICPHRTNRKKAPVQDGRKLRCYTRRWKVERTLAWIGHFRRLVGCWDHKIEMYQGFFHIACMLIMLNKLRNGF